MDFYSFNDAQQLSIKLDKLLYINTQAQKSRSVSQHVFCCLLTSWPESLKLHGLGHQASLACLIQEYLIGYIELTQIVL